MKVIMLIANAIMLIIGASSLLTATFAVDVMAGLVLTVCFGANLLYISWRTK
jgi:hypothetical protein